MTVTAMSAKETLFWSLLRRKRSRLSKSSAAKRESEILLKSFKTSSTCRRKAIILKGRAVLSRRLSLKTRKTGVRTQESLSREMPLRTVSFKLIKNFKRRKSSKRSLKRSLNHLSKNQRRFLVRLASLSLSNREKKAKS